MLCCVVLLSLFAFIVLSCDVRYDFRIKRMFGSSLPPALVGGLMSYLRYLCLLTHSGVQHMLCCVVSFLFLLLYFVLLILYWQCFLDCPSMIAPSVLFGIILLNLYSYLI